MSTKMRQVSKEEFEVLTRFHPGEVRYYVDVGKALNTRHKGAKVNVKRKPIAKKIGKKAKRAGPKPGKEGRAINGTGRGMNKPIIYTGKDAGYILIGSVSKKVEAEVKRVYEGDATRVVGRSDLAKIVMRNTGLARGSVHPCISDLIKRGTLRIKEATS